MGKMMFGEKQLDALPFDRVDPAELVEYQLFSITFSLTQTGIAERKDFRPLGAKA